MRPSDVGLPLTGRRTVPRFVFDAQAELVEPQTKSQIFGRVTEISLRGCFTEVPNPLGGGSVVQLRIVKDGEIFTTQAREMYQRSGSGVGLRFIETAPDQAKLLAAWLKALGTANKTK
jgi:hypothetical protein